MNGSFVIDQATTTTVVSVPGERDVYTGAAQTPCTVAVTGAGGLSLTPAATYAANAAAGTATASYAFAGDGNYLASNDSTSVHDRAGAGDGHGR